MSDCQFDASAVFVYLCNLHQKAAHFNKCTHSQHSWSFNLEKSASFSSFVLQIMPSFSFGDLSMLFFNRYFQTANNVG